MISNAIDNIAHYVEAAIRLPYDILPWFCGRVVAIATNISNCLSNQSGQDNHSTVQQTNISDRNVSSAPSQPQYHERYTETNCVFSYGDLEQTLDLHDSDFATAEEFTREKTRLLKQAEQDHLNNEIDMFRLTVKTKANPEGKKVEFILTPQS